MLRDVWLVSFLECVTSVVVLLYIYIYIYISGKNYLCSCGIADELSFYWHCYGPVVRIGSVISDRQSICVEPSVWRIVSFVSDYTVCLFVGILGFWVVVQRFLVICNGL